MRRADECGDNDSVHPHGRGDNATTSLSVPNPGGSPPRAWGQYAPVGAEPAGGRFTPTGVGTILISLCALSATSVHPHGRGDNVVDVLLQVVSSGSPPRAWGQSRWRCVRRVRVRFTPTGVGTMECVTDAAHQLPVHPHGRGDNFCHVIARARGGGSPPRAWGQCRVFSGARWYNRFTPTGVGTIDCHSAQFLESPVHPHGRGDNMGSGMRSRILCGSPPRAWGQYGVMEADMVTLRFTPTGVGTIFSLRRAAVAPPVHPHGRGDNGGSCDGRYSSAGSPPRAWGQSACVYIHVDVPRFTPTGVGTICTVR